MNTLWMWFLCRLNGWTVRQVRQAYLREKVRIFKRALERRDAWKN